MKLLAFGKVFQDEPLTARLMMDTGTSVFLAYPEDFWDVTTLLQAPAPQPVCAVVQLVNRHVIQIGVDCQIARRAHALVSEMVNEVTADARIV